MELISSASAGTNGATDGRSLIEQGAIQFRPSDQLHSDLQTHPSPRVQKELAPNYAAAAFGGGHHRNRANRNGRLHTQIKSEKVNTLTEAFCKSEGMGPKCPSQT